MKITNSRMTASRSRARLFVLVVLSASGLVSRSEAVAVDTRHFVSVYLPGRVVAVSCVSPLGVSSRHFRPAVVRAVADVKTAVLDDRFPEAGGYKVTGVVGADFAAFRVVGPKAKLAELLMACQTVQRLQPIITLPSVLSIRIGPLTPVDQFVFPIGSPTRRGFAEFADDASLKEVNLALKSQIAGEVSAAAVAGEFEVAPVGRWASGFRFGRLPTAQERFRVFTPSAGPLRVPGKAADTYVWALDTSSLKVAECWRVAVNEKMRRIADEYPQALTADFQMREVDAMEGSFFAFDMSGVSNTLDRVGVLDILKSDFTGPSGRSQAQFDSSVPADVVSKESSRRATDLFRWGAPVFPVRQGLTSRECPGVAFPSEKALRLY